VLTPFWLLAALYALLTAVAFVGMIMPTLRRTVTKPVKRIAPIGSAATAS
jgi:ABC-type Fe3+-siderophore transport system permease subunit